MKTIAKIGIVILVLAILAAGALYAVSAGALTLFEEPVVVDYEPQPIPTDPPVEMVEVEAEEAEPALPRATEEKTYEKTEKSTGTTDLIAKKYFVYDIRRGEYLQKLGSETEKLYPASITKLLTCYVVLQYLQPDEVVTAGDALDLVPGDSSVAGFEKGDQVTVDQLIGAMMLPSGNDAAQMAAVTAGRRIAGNEELSPSSAVAAFMEEMNAQAKALGMENSNFVTPDGFHRDDHYTTMDDLVILCKKVLAEPTILKYASMAKTELQMGERTLEWVNTNLLLQEEWQYHMPNTIGLKTGYTDTAGGCLVSAFVEEDTLLLIGVFGSTPFTEDRYLDTVDIYNSI